MYLFSFDTEITILMALTPAPSGWVGVGKGNEEWRNEGWKKEKMGMIAATHPGRAYTREFSGVKPKSVAPHHKVLT